jgi:hypothetical protein
VQAKEENKSINRAASHINFAGLSENENMLSKENCMFKIKKNLDCHCPRLISKL